MNQDRKPLFEKLAEHGDSQPVSFHVPGHKYGKLLSDEANPFFQEILKLDATEISGLDDLHSPEGIIADAQLLLAEYYGAKKSFFLVNGSTVGSLAMMMAAIKENDVVFVQRNCHKSIMNGIALTKSLPVFLQPEYNLEWGVAGCVALQTVEEAIATYPKVKVIILTYPNYYGMVNELASIIEVAHEKGIIVLIDEAHGAHFAAGSPFPTSAVHLGADGVVQSAHKTLPAMTMGAYLHVNGELLDVNEVGKYLSILQSSSPSYPIMASLDLARHYLATFTSEDLHYTIETVNRFRDALQQVQGIRVLSYNTFEGDPLKITIQPQSAMSGFELQSALESKGIFSELADPYNVLLVFPLLKAEVVYPIEKTITALSSIMENEKVLDDKLIKSTFQKPKISQLKIPLHRQALQSRLRIELDDAIGEICAQMVIPYPPGIPLLFPGEMIEQSDIDIIKFLVKAGARFQSENNIINEKIEVYKENNASGG